MVKFWNSRIPEWEGRLTLPKGGGSRSFMTMTKTIWWPRSGMWIYQIVTGVTSVVGVPSTHLVLCRNCVFSGWYNCFFAINVGILQNFVQTSNTRSTPIPRPTGWAMCVIPVLCEEKWPWDFRSVLYGGVYRRISRLVFFCGIGIWCIIDISAGHVTPLGAGIQVTWHILISNGMIIQCCFK